uniref:Uncharacterized protein n=2 Tax=Cacopsylla melanoneura TaxID=428564 RepID=A0A8D8Z4T2_9HEMI
MDSKWTAIILIYTPIVSYVLSHDCGENSTTEPNDPFWYNPCTSGTETGKLSKVAIEASLHSQDNDWDKQISRGLPKVRRHVKMVRKQFKNDKIFSLYSEVQALIRNDNDDILVAPMWIPAQGNMNSLLTTELTSKREIVKFIPEIYTDLQKFAVAFEHMSNMAKKHHEDRKDINDAMNELVYQLSGLLCEIYSALVSLEVSVPVAINRNIMSFAEREALSSQTTRSVWDYTVLVKYRDYTRKLMIFLKNNSVSSGRIRHSKNNENRHMNDISISNSMEHLRHSNSYNVIASR